MVVLSGLVAMIDHQGGVEREILVLGRGGYAGIVAGVTGERAYLTAVVREAGTVLIVSAEILKELIGNDRVLGDLILQLVLRRREWLSEEGAGVRILGSRFSPDTHRLRDFATRNRVAHVWVDLEQHGDADLKLMYAGIDPADTPVVLVRAGEVLRNPTNAQFAQAIGLRGGEGPLNVATYDVVIIGAGPAGLAAAVYGATSGLSVIALDAVAAGGQAATSALIENYLGFPSGLSGAELAERALLQADKFGAHLRVPCRAVRLAEQEGYHLVGVDDGSEMAARSVIIASGVQYRRLEVPHLADFEGVGVAYTSAGVEEQLDPGDSAVVVGGANSAGQAALSLTARGHRVYLVIREADVVTSMARYLIDRIEREGAIEVIYHSEVVRVDGRRHLEGVTIQDNRDRSRRSLQARAMFILIGAEPHTQWLQDAVRLDPGGYVVSGQNLDRRTSDQASWQALARQPYLLETSRPGVFVAGDVRSGSVKRVATAAGEGSMAVRFAQEYLLRGASMASYPDPPL
jgi:thioredoxin reductase (NADPH)